MSFLNLLNCFLDPYTQLFNHLNNSEEPVQASRENPLIEKVSVVYEKSVNDSGLTNSSQDSSRENSPVLEHKEPEGKENEGFDLLSHSSAESEKNNGAFTYTTSQNQLNTDCYGIEKVSSDELEEQKEDQSYELYKMFKTLENDRPRINPLKKYQTPPPKVEQELPKFPVSKDPDVNRSIAFMLLGRNPYLSKN